MNDPSTTETSHNQPSADLNVEVSEEESMLRPWHGMSVATYLKTRITTLKPPMHVMPNPIKLMLGIDARGWSFFFVAWWAWVSLLTICYFGFTPFFYVANACFSLH